MTMRSSRSARWAGALLVALGMCLAVSPAARAAPKTHLFILSGQSNMNGLDPNLSFTPTVTKALAPDKVIVVKASMPGQPIRRWYRKWQPPKGMVVSASKYPWGDLYDYLMRRVNPAIKGIRPDTVTFVWMQGEKDAKQALSAVYAKSFRGLVAQLDADLNRTDINVVIGRLSDYDMNNEKYVEWTKIRDIQVQLGKADPRTECVDTDDLNGDENALHYTHEGYVELGKRFAEKALGLIAKYAKAPAAPGTIDPSATSSPEKPWFFIVAADPQLSGKPIDEQNWAAAIRQINRLKPDFLVVCGDLTFGSGKSADHAKPQNMSRDNKLADAYNKIVAGLDKSITLYNVAGNHDVGLDPTAETIDWYGKHFGMPYVCFTHRGSFIMTVESNLLRDGSNAPDQAARELAWLKGTLGFAKDMPYAHRIVFMHQPLYVKSADEKDSYWNYPAARRKELLTLFHDTGVDYVFAGHTHRNSHATDGGMQMFTTTTAALGPSTKNNPHGVRIVKVYPDRIEQKFYAYDDLPDKVEFETR